MNLIFKVFVFSIQYATAKYKNKEKQLKKLQMSAKDTAWPIVFHLAKENVLSLSKEIVPEAVKETLKDMTKIQQMPVNVKLFSSVSGVLSDAVPVNCAKSKLCKKHSS